MTEEQIIAAAEVIYKRRDLAMEIDRLEGHISVLQERMEVIHTERNRLAKELKILNEENS